MLKTLKKIKIICFSFSGFTLAETVKPSCLLPEHKNSYSRVFRECLMEKNIYILE